eukprot:sb/3465849/
MSDNFNCTICLDICSDAVATHCCHQIYCEGCVSRCTSCPNCRHHPVSTYISVPVRRMIGNLPINCGLCGKATTRSDLAKHKEDFCEERLVKCDLCFNSMAWKTLDSHKLNSCPKRFVECRKCKSKILPWEIEEHNRNSCPQRIVSCSECKDTMSFSNLSSHAMFCRKRLFKCALCSEQVRFYQLDYHTKHSCLERPVQCQYCEERMPAKTVSSHAEFCLKRPVRCKDCGISYPTDSTHMNNYHCPMRYVNCQLCSEKVRCSHLDNHMRKSCPERKVLCPHCKVALPAKTVESHKQYCQGGPVGGRSVRCSSCGKLDQASSIRSHEQRCPERLVQCRDCGEKVKALFLENHSVSRCPVRHGIMCVTPTAI